MMMQLRHVAKEDAERLQEVMDDAASVTSVEGSVLSLEKQGPKGGISQPIEIGL